MDDRHFSGHFDLVMSEKELQFLGLPEAAAAFDEACVLILPMPLEATVSYGSGTAVGPSAIIEASQQVELYDREFGRELALEYGIHTLPPVAVGGDVKTAVQAIETAVTHAAGNGRFVVGLGGEHTVSLGFGRGLLAALGGPITIVQIDAHSDLRHIYEDDPYSHACVARRLLEEEGVEQILQLGIRSTCPEEVELVAAHPDKLRVWYSEAVHAGGWQEEFIARIQNRRVYLTLDVDGLDPSIIPTTGTPEPDGLTWSETLDIVRTLARAAHIVGMDCVELAPSPGLHMADFATAKLVYKMIAYALEFGHTA
jgi:agmatinase